ncbi:SDR family oxidoreductase [Leptospira noguchii]|uniref:SDR family oxidoreductase n=1 Tax=Leptospira noguchii TaxID=28182 RepID=UPI0007739566|nr:SDR family oxidoreductase [Leptospira noguchii]
MEKLASNYITKLFNLEGKVAAVIGGGGHLCSEMAKGFARAGCKVVVIDLRKEKADRVADEIKLEGYSRPLSLALDVSKKEEHKACLKEILSKLGDLDILINGAGINGPSPFFEISLEEWNSVLDSQITGTFLGCQVFGEYMVGKGKGSIINISSASAGPPLSKVFTYSVAKAGIKNLTQNLGREWGMKGVRVNAIRPGFFPTEWNRKNVITPEREKSILTHTPMGRFGEPNELLGAILWLASDASRFVTGAEIAVDGGFSCMTI